MRCGLFILSHKDITLKNDKNELKENILAK